MRQLHVGGPAQIELIRPPVEHGVLGRHNRARGNPDVAVELELQFVTTRD